MLYDVGMTNDQDSEQRLTQPMERIEHMHSDALHGSAFVSPEIPHEPAHSQEPSVTIEAKPYEERGQTIYRTTPPETQPTHRRPKHAVMRAASVVAMAAAPYFATGLSRAAAQDEEPQQVAMATGDANLREAPGTQSAVESLMPANTSVTVESKVVVDNEVWYQVKTVNADGTEERSWVFENLLQVEQPEELPDVTTIAQMEMLDMNGNPTENQFGSSNVNLASLQEKFQEMIGMGLPAETFAEGNLHVLYLDSDSVVFEQKNAISSPDENNPDRKNEAGNIITVRLNEEGQAIDWGFWGVGQVAAVSNQIGSNLDPSQAKFVPTGEGYYLSVAGPDGIYAVFNWVDALDNMRDPNVPDAEKIADATIVAASPLPFGQVSVTENNLEVNGQVFAISVGSFDIRVATPPSAESAAVSPVSEGIPSVESLNLSLHNPELIGNPEFITQASVKMPNGENMTVNVFGDQDLLKGKGFKLFDFTDESGVHLQQIADTYLQDTPSVIPVLSFNNAERESSKGQLQDPNDISGIEYFETDISKVNIILTADSTPEMVSFWAHNEGGVYIEPGTDNLTMYVNTMWVGNPNLSPDSYIYNVNFLNALSMPWGYIRFYQEEWLKGRNSAVEVASDFGTLINNARHPMTLIDQQALDDNFNLIMNDLLPTMQPR